MLHYVIAGDVSDQSARDFHFPLFRVQFSQGCAPFRPAHFLLGRCVPIPIRTFSATSQSADLFSNHAGAASPALGSFREIQREHSRQSVML
jgi:hypothetical protein